jgi:hypothetical protein
MKILFSISLFFLLSVVACNNKELPVLSENVQDQSPSKSTGDAMINHPLFDMASNPRQHTLEEMDRLYRETLVRDAQKPYLENLRKIAIYAMVKSYHLCDQPGAEMVSFYAKELNSMLIIDPLVLSQMLQKLKGAWTGRELALFAADAYSRNATTAIYLRPEDFTPERKAQWDALKSAFPLN